MEYDRHILKSNNLMRTSWKLMKKEYGKDCKNYGFQSTIINGRSITNHHIIANAFTNHVTTFPDMISCKINASNCFTKPSDNKEHKFAFCVNHVFRN